MIELNEQDGAYLEMCKHFKAIYETKKIQDNPEDKKMVILSMLCDCVICCFFIAKYIASIFVELHLSAFQVL